MKRRSFLRRIGIAVAAAPALPALVQEEEKLQAKPKPSGDGYLMMDQGEFKESFDDLFAEEMLKAIRKSQVTREFRV